MPENPNTQYKTLELNEQGDMKRCLYLKCRHRQKSEKGKIWLD